MIMSRFGVKLEEETLIRKVRRIPAQGEVFVDVGDMVDAEKVIAGGTVRNPEAVEVKVFAKLGVEPEIIPIKDFSMMETIVGICPYHIRGILGGEAEDEDVDAERAPGLRRLLGL